MYEQNLREYSEWTKLTYVDQIHKDHLFEYRKHLMDGGKERLTADCKLLRINKMVKVTLKLDHGKGSIKKSDLGKMKPNGDPDIYSAPSFPEGRRPPRSAIIEAEGRSHEEQTGIQGLCCRGSIMRA